MDEDMTPADMDYEMEAPSNSDALKKSKRRSQPETLMDRVLQTPLKRRSSYPTISNAFNDPIGRIRKRRPDFGTRSLMDRTLSQRRVCSLPHAANFGYFNELDTEETPSRPPRRKAKLEPAEDDSMLVDRHLDSDIELDLNKLRIRSPEKSHRRRCMARICGLRKQVHDLKLELEAERDARRRAQYAQIAEYRKRVEMERTLEDLQIGISSI